MLIFLLTLTKKVSILTSFSLLKKVSALSSKLTKKVSFEVRGVHSPQLGQWSGFGYYPKTQGKNGTRTRKLTPDTTPILKTQNMLESSDVVG